MQAAVLAAFNPVPVFRAKSFAGEGLERGARSSRRADCLKAGKSLKADELKADSVKASCQETIGSAATKKTQTQEGCASEMVNRVAVGIEAQAGPFGSSLGPDQVGEPRWLLLFFELHEVSPGLDEAWATP